MPDHSGSHAARTQDGLAVLADRQVDAALQNVKRCVKHGTTPIKYGAAHKILATGGPRHHS